MKLQPKILENMKNHGFSRLIVFVLFLFTIFSLFYSLRMLNFSKPIIVENRLRTFNHYHQYDDKLVVPSPPAPPPPLPPSIPTPDAASTSYNGNDFNKKTTIHHVVFCIATSTNNWNRRKEYIKLWWRPGETRGAVWLDKPVEISVEEEKLLPQLKISSNTSKFKYKHPKGDRSAIRLSRIVSEAFRLGMKDVRWFVMCDDDTNFFVDNLVRVLEKYDHNEFYYIGSSSESHLQNIKEFSYDMAYGGAGFAISYPLAKVLAKMQDKCIRRYPRLYGSDDRIHACMSELGVHLTKEAGFHQLDVYGNIFGLLAAHPIAPLVSLHHLDIIEPIFPGVDQVQALKRFKAPVKLDSAALLQQSICYDKSRTWTISVSWGYAVQIIRGIILPREIEKPGRTFLNWYPKADYTGFSFNTRNVPHNSCQTPFIYFLRNALYNSKKNETASEYMYVGRNGGGVTNPRCKGRKKVADPSQIIRVVVYKKPNPSLWDKHRRRDCCRVLPTKREDTLVVEVGVCRENEIIGVQ